LAVGGVNGETEGPLAELALLEELHRALGQGGVEAVMSDNYFSPATTIKTPHLDPAGDN
jgi:hypothetical protein